MVSVNLDYAKSRIFDILTLTLSAKIKKGTLLWKKLLNRTLMYYRKMKI